MNAALTDIERSKLLNKRDKLEKEIKALNELPIGKSNASKTFRLYDLNVLAHKIVLIDRRLGRIE